MMKIDLKLFVTLSQYLPEDTHCLEIPEETSVQNLIEKLSIPEGQVKLIFVNGKKADSSYRLKPNDRVGLFPPVGGG